MSTPSKRGRSLAEFMPSIEDEEASPTANTALEGVDRSRTEQQGKGSAKDATPPDMVALHVFVTSADRKRLRQLCLDADTSLQKLGHEAWNLLLTKKGLPSLQPLAANRPSGRLSKG